VAIAKQTKENVTFMLDNPNLRILIKNCFKLHFATKVSKSFYVSLTSYYGYNMTF